MVRPGVNKFSDRSHWGIPYLGENKYTGMIRFSRVIRSAHFPKNIRCSFGVRYSEILPKHSHSFSGVLTSFERPLCCVHLRDFKSSLFMSPAINLAFGEVSKMLSQFHNNQRSLDGKPRERSKSWLVVDTFATNILTRCHSHLSSSLFSLPFTKLQLHRLYVRLGPLSKHFFYYYLKISLLGEQVRCQYHFTAMFQINNKDRSNYSLVHIFCSYLKSL